MPHEKQLATAVRRVLQDVGRGDDYALDAFRGFGLDEWHVHLIPNNTNVRHLTLRFTLGANPDWNAVTDEAKRQLQSDTSKGAQKD